MTDPEKVKEATDAAAEDARDNRAHKILLALGIVGAVGVLLLAGALWWQSTHINDQGAQIAALRDNGNVVATQAQQLAQQVRSLGGTPVVSPAAPGPSGPQGIPGTPGTPGRGIASTALTDGHLIVTYTDGATADLGQVAGTPGTPGTAGRSITGTTVGGTGHLMVAYSDGQTTDAGAVVGRDGAPGTNGTNGTNGRGVSQVVASSSGHLVVVYTDGTSSDAGQLPPGPAGSQGTPGAQGVQGVSVTDVVFARDSSGTCQVVVTLHDPVTGTDSTVTHTAGAAACPLITTNAKATR